MDQLHVKQKKRLEKAFNGHPTRSLEFIRAYKSTCNLLGFLNEHFNSKDLWFSSPAIFASREKFELVFGSFVIVLSATQINCLASPYRAYRSNLPFSDIALFFMKHVDLYEFDPDEEKIKLV